MKENKKFKVLVVDDKPEARFILKFLLEEIDNIEIVGEATNSVEALYLLVTHYPNLVLLDINMPGINGIEFVQLINKRNIDIPVVIVSAHENFAIQAIRSGIYDFLLKPVSREELKNVIEKFRRKNAKDLPAKLMEVLNSIREDSKIRINSKNSYILVSPSDIVFCKAEEGYTLIHMTNGKKEVASTTLTIIATKVKEHNFFRLGRSALINQNYIRTINTKNDTCTLKYKKNEWEVQASHRAIKELLTTNFSYA